MPALILVSPERLAGKTTIAVGLARRIAAEGKSVSLTRLPGGEHAEADAALFETLGLAAQGPARADVTLSEAPDGAPPTSPEGHTEARTLVVAASPTPASELADYCQPLSDRLAGVIINKTPARRLEAVRAAAEESGLPVIAMLPEDRLLAAPALRDVARTLAAQVEHLGNGGLKTLDRPVIATISADPGQGYFTGYDASAVIVRSDKPDLQLAALNAGATCLILTGGLPLLSYVLERAEQDEIPLLRTDMDTMSAVQSIEGTFATLPFAGGREQLDRIGALLADVDITPLTGKTGRKSRGGAG